MSKQVLTDLDLNGRSINNSLIKTPGTGGSTVLGYDNIGGLKGSISVPYVGGGYKFRSASDENSILINIRLSISPRLIPMKYIINNYKAGVQIYTGAKWRYIVKPLSALSIDEFDVSSSINISNFINNNNLLFNKDNYISENNQYRGWTLNPKGINVHNNGFAKLAGHIHPSTSDGKEIKHTSHIRFVVDYDNGKRLYHSIISPLYKMLYYIKLNDDFSIKDSYLKIRKFPPTKIIKG